MKPQLSPLRFPERSGSTIRYVTSVLFIALGIAMTVMTVGGIRAGLVISPSHHRTTYIRISDHPLLFWATAVGYFAIAFWLSYASIAEILYASRKQKQRKSSN